MVRFRDMKVDDNVNQNKVEDEVRDDEDQAAINGIYKRQRNS